jgi:hypothetical protein
MLYAYCEDCYVVHILKAVNSFGLDDLTLHTFDFLSYLSACKLTKKIIG